MRLLIVGASRGIGLELVRQALQAGHAVTALARHPVHVPADQALLQVQAGDILATAAMLEAVARSGRRLPDHRQRSNF